MAAMDGNGGRGPWSYREQIGISSSYTISSSSGTVSTGYTSNGSHLSWISLEAARHFQEMEEEDADEFVHPVKKTRKVTENQYADLARLKRMSIKTAKEMKMEQIKSLAKEFFGAPSVKCSIKRADMSVLDKWFEKLGVGWVLHLPDGAPAGKLGQTLDASSWIRALNEIRDACTAYFSSGDGSAKEEGPGTEDSEEQDVMTDQVQFASFAQQAMLKMLAFVDLFDAPNLNITCDDPNIHLVAPPYQKLYTMLRVHNALFIYWPSYPPPSVERIQKKVASILSAKKHKASEAIWNTMEKIMSGILESVGDGDDSSGTPTPQGSSDIHKAIRSVMCYIRFLQSSSMDTIVSEAVSLGKYVPQIECIPPLISLVVEMVSCIQEKLVNKSAKLPHQSLMFLFLLNNSSFIRDLIHQSTFYFPESYKEVLTSKVEGYMESYIQVSWAPLLACLLNPKPLRLFGKNYSTLKFESEFHKTYTTQKLWKVPDPKLRKTLREAIIVKIVPSYTKYIEDNNVSTPKFTPQNLEEMLQEMFEG